jgi:hypothetical protein
MSAGVDLKSALSCLGEPFSGRVYSSYLSLRSAVADSAWDAAGLRAGIFCESVLRFLQQELTGTFTPFGDKLPVFTDECARLQRSPKTAGPESLRLILPRAIDLVYTLRNKRGIGHAGGDVEANQIDAVTAARVADWCVCELLRLKHAVSLEEAQAIVDSIAVRQLPEVWAVLGKRRVLDAGLDYKSQVLLLLHGADASGIAIEDLREWVEHDRPARFVERVVSPLHNERLVEYDRDSGMVLLSPTGAQRVEEVLLPKLRSGLKRATA